MFLSIRLIYSDSMISKIPFIFFIVMNRAYKRKKRVVYKKMDLTKKQATDRWWIVLYNPEVVDKNGAKVPQGYCQISLEMIPKTLASEVPNGPGREQPNQFPILDEPKGRFAFVSY